VLQTNIDGTKIVTSLSFLGHSLARM